MFLIYHLMKDVQNIIILAYTNLKKCSMENIEANCSQFD